MNNYCIEKAISAIIKDSQKHNKSQPFKKKKKRLKNKALILIVINEF